MDRGEQLLATLRAHLDRAEVRFSEALEPLDGGYSNEIFRFRLEDAPSPFDQPLVLRLTHDERDTAREGIVENGVAEQGFPAPPILLRGGSSSAFGRPFLVTPLSPGVAFNETITARTAIGAFHRLPDQLAAAMVALHGVPTENITARLTAEGWEPDRLDSLAVLADVDDYAEQANSSDLRRRAAVLRKNQPSFTRPVVCHGDLHPFNLLFEGREVVIVLDWELARLADPAYDVGRTLVLLRLAPYPMSRITRTVIQPLATALARAFERRYRERNPLHEISVRWHEALHCLRTLAIVEVGASLASGSRLRRAADVWFPVASRLEHRFASDSDRIEVRERYLAGETANALAEAFDVSRATIFAILQRAGIKSRYRVLTDLDVVAATTMYEAGRSLASIAHHFGVAGPGRHGCVEGTAAS